MRFLLVFLLYDILERRYMDAIIQPAWIENEYRAMTEMIDRSRLKGKTIIMADRGYESYNIFAHAEKKGWNYLIRVKDKGSNGMVSGYQLPKQDEFDISVSTILTRKQTNEVKINSSMYNTFIKLHHPKKGLEHLILRLFLQQNSIVSFL